MTARFPCLLSDICLAAREFLNSQEIKLKKIGNSFSSFWLYQRTDHSCPRVAKCCANHVSFAVAPNLQPHVLLGNPVWEVKRCHTPGPQCACVPAHGTLQKSCICITFLMLPTVLLFVELVPCSFWPPTSASAVFQLLNSLLWKRRYLCK